MKIIAVVVALIALRSVEAIAQPSPDMRSHLSSADSTERESAARELAAQYPLRPDAKTTLVDLLAREKGLIRPAFQEGAGGPGDGEGYAEYIGWLSGEVMKIAEAEPDRTDVWNALLAAYPGNGNTAYGKWLGTHGDKALPYLLAHARDHRADDLDKQNRIDALASLAQIAAYERQPVTVKHLSAADLKMVEDLVRSGIGDADMNVRLATVVALEIIGDPQDLPALDQIALTDSYVTHDGGPSGAETHFFLREFTRGAAERVRAKLAAKAATDNVR